MSKIPIVCTECDWWEKIEATNPIKPYCPNCGEKTEVDREAEQIPEEDRKTWFEG